MHRPCRNIVVVGASYVGLRTAQDLARVVPEAYRCEDSPDRAAYAFQPYLQLCHEHKAFVPYGGVFAQSAGAGKHQVINASVLGVAANHIIIDREWEGSKKIDFEYLAIATGTQLAAPAMMKCNDKATSSQYLKQHQQQVRNAQNVVVIGAGAVGVQLATDIKELYPTKTVTLIHSRDRVMSRFHPQLHGIVAERLEELGVRLITGCRVPIPQRGFPTDGHPFDVVLSNGESIATDLVILATGQKPNNAILDTLPSTSNRPLVNPENGLISVQDTMQIQDPGYPQIFAVGDVADTNAPKAARPGYVQAEIAAKNIRTLIDGGVPSEHLKLSPGGIHLSLGLRRAVKFRNPDVEQLDAKPRWTLEQDGVDDLNVGSWWQRLNVPVQDPKEYHL